MKMGSENENIFRHIQNALIYSGAGLKAAWVNEMAFRTEAIVIALMMPIGIWIGETAAQRFAAAFPNLAPWINIADNVILSETQ